jgi:hypothetical protein
MLNYGNWYSVLKNAIGLLLVKKTLKEKNSIKTVEK